MTTATPQTFDLSRPGLRQFSHWIRDELDPLVAREGPELLRADDVLILHDIFQALKTSSGVTALDLRATGVHRAIMEISGIATRWPGRLADDCDELIDLWTAKFGRLEDLHPFLYGRGGRLEGIATIDETSRLVSRYPATKRDTTTYYYQALLKRWHDTCPDKILPKRARRRGSLGFNPGSWWINTLFACHAGIIDIDTIDGGICHDKYGAYAVVILEGGELDSPNESTLTYRCSKDDRGKFRLTAATPRSREPVRVLRSHSVNSMWGPKAGVRYEGLYRVIGWAVHQPKTSTSNAGQQVRLGDTYYDVHLERCDPVPLHEVAKSPSAFELDDYSEYKRLRKVRRDLRNKGVAGSTDANKITHVPVKVAPVISLPAPILSGRVSSARASPDPSRSTTYTFAPGKELSGTSEYVLSGTSTIATEGDAHVTPWNLTDLSIPAAISSFVRTETSHSDPYRFHTPSDSKDAGSITSTLQSRRSITEVAPWINYDLPHLTLPTTDDLALSKRSTTRSHFAPDQADSPTIDPRKESNKNGGHRYTVLLRPTSSIQDLDPGIDLRRKESSKSTLMRSRNPVPKLFDGAEDESSTGVNYFSQRRPRAASANSERLFNAPGRGARASSTGDTPQPVAPIPVNHTGPGSLLFERRDAVAFPYGCAISPLFPSDLSLESLSRFQWPEHHPSQSMPTGCTGSLLTSLNDHIASCSVATASNSSPGAVQTDIHCRSSSYDIADMRTRDTRRLRDIASELGELGVEVAFRDPFKTLHLGEDKRRTQSCNVSPRTIA